MKAKARRRWERYLNQLIDNHLFTTHVMRLADDMPDGWLSSPTAYWMPGALEQLEAIEADIAASVDKVMREVLRDSFVTPRGVCRSAGDYPRARA